MSIRVRSVSLKLTDEQAEAVRGLQHDWPLSAIFAQPFVSLPNDDARNGSMIVYAFENSSALVLKALMDYMMTHNKEVMTEAGAQ